MLTALCSYFYSIVHIKIRGHYIGKKKRMCPFLGYKRIKFKNFQVNHFSSEIKILSPILGNMLLESKRQTDAAHWSGTTKRLRVWAWETSSISGSASPFTSWVTLDRAPRLSLWDLLGESDESTFVYWQLSKGPGTQHTSINDSQGCYGCYYISVKKIYAEWIIQVSLNYRSNPR